MILLIYHKFIKNQGKQPLLKRNIFSGALKKKTFLKYLLKYKSFETIRKSIALLRNLIELKVIF